MSITRRFIALASLVALMVPSFAWAQVTSSYWILSAGTIKPSIAAWTETLPYLGGGGIQSVCTTNAGLLQAGGCGSSFATSSITAVYPIVWNTSTAQISIAFGTTTSNTWAGTQTFTNSPVFSTLGAGTVNSASNGIVYSTSTSTPTVTAPITYSGTLGQFIGGSSGAFACTNASNGVTGCMSSLDWGLLHTATTTFSSPLSYSLSTNAVTCPTCFTGTAPATSTFAATAPVFVTTSSSAITYSWYGLSTTSQPASSNVLVSNGSNGVYGAATSSETCTSPLSCGSHVVLAGGGAISIPQANGSTNGYLASSDWTIFNNKSTFATSTLTAGTGIAITAGNNVTISQPSYVATSTAETRSSLAYAATTNGTPAGLSWVATTSATCGTGVSCTAFPVIGSVNPSFALSVPVSIANGGTNNTAAYTSGSAVYSDGAKLTQDNSNFYWDASNHRLGLSSTTPATLLSVAGSGYLTGGFGVGLLNTTAGTIQTSGLINVDATAGYQQGGLYALRSNGNPNFNTFVGQTAGNATLFTGGSTNMALGFGALQSATSTANDTAIGVNALALAGNTTGSQASNDTAIGSGALINLTGGTTNTAIGFNSFTGITTGSFNTSIGSSAGISLTTGQQNVAIGYNVDFKSASANGQLTIQNIIYGTGNTGQGASVSTGNIGIGTTTPWRQFSTTGTVAFPGLTTSGSTQTDYLCLASTGEVIADTVSCLVSGEQYKHAVAPLTGSLAEVLKLHPVTFRYNKTGNNTFDTDPNRTGWQIGFIAQQAQIVDPRLVAVSASGTPQTFRYENYTALLTGAVQQIERQIQAILGRLDGDEVRLRLQQREITQLQREFIELQNEYDKRSN